MRIAALCLAACAAWTAFAQGREPSLARFPTHRGSRSQRYRNRDARTARHHPDRPGQREGQYVLTLLPVGTYIIRVEAAGFKTFSQQGIGLTSNQNVRVDAKLEVGSLSESIQITAEAPLVTAARRRWVP